MSSEQARDLRQRGIAAAKAGQKEAARQLLQQAIKLEPNNESAWLWMTSIATDTREKLFCLKKLLEINPQNATALQALKALGITPEKLLGQDTPAAAPPAAPPPATSAPSPISPPAYDSLREYAYADEPEDDPRQSAYLEGMEIPTPGEAGLPVPDPTWLDSAVEEANEIVQGYLYATSEADTINWVKKEKRRAGERDVLVLRFQVGATIFAVLTVVALVAGAIILNNPDARAVLFAPTHTATATFTVTPTATLGITPTPSSTPDITLTPSPTIDPFITPGRRDVTPSQTPIGEFLPVFADPAIRTAVALLNNNDPEPVFPLVGTQAIIDGRFNPNTGYTEAIAYLRRGDPDTALETIQAAEAQWLAEAPGEPFGDIINVGYAEIELELAQRALAAGRTAEAEDYFDDIETRMEETIASNPRYTLAYVFLARRYSLEGNLDAALEVINGAFERVPELIRDTYLREERTRIYFAQGDYDSARQEAYETLYIDPFNEAALAIQVESALAQDLPGWAVIYSQEYLIRYPNSVRGFKLWADAHLLEGKTDLALDYYSRALQGDETDPYYIPALLARAELYQRQGRYSLAADDYSRAFDLTEDPIYRATRMQMAYLGGDYETAQDDAAALLGEGVIPDAEILLIQARILVDQAEAGAEDTYSEARDLLNRSLGSGLSGGLRPVAEEYLARAELTLGNYPAALNAINRAIDAADSGSRRYIRGQIYEAQGSYAAARDDYDWILTWSSIYPYTFRDEVRLRLEYTQAITRIPDDWALLSADTVALWLPESFVGGAVDIEAIREELADVNPDFADTADTIDPDSVLFWAFDSEVEAGDPLTNVNITSEAVPDGETLASYFEAQVEALPTGIRVIEQELITVIGQDAARLIVEATVSGTRLRLIIYVYIQDETAYALTLTTAAAQFEERLPDFERTATLFIAGLAFSP